MNATARELPGAEAMDETIAYEHGSGHTPDSGVDNQGQAQHDEQPGRDRPTGLPDMPTPMPQGQNRYTYSSGARPLDGYTIKRAIGRGGFGEVYYATSDSGKEVALKLILRNLDVERRGVVQCMNLKCPNLLTVYDLKTNDAGDAFVVMEYVAGPSLANVLADHPQGMPVAEVRAWLKGLVEGVAYLHDHGIVHRDLKPANLFMEEGMVKIGDYGLAKLINPSQGSEHSDSIGTCHYMAPELASGKYNKPIDVYAMGVILYEMLTGRVPFEGETVGEVLMKHLTARPDLSGLAEPFRSIIRNALAKDPNQRPQRVYDLLPADDMPKSPNVRFIGDGKNAPRLPEEPSGRGKPKPDDSVLRIEAEESVFYIGPETRPPRQPRPPIADRFRAGLAALRRPINAPPVAPQARRPTPPPPPQPQPVMARPPQPQPQQVRMNPQPAAKGRGKKVPPPPPQAPEPPPPLPSARVRLAELTGSMALAAPIAVAFTIPTAIAMDGDSALVTERAALLFGLTLLGTWATLIPGKIFEGKGDSITRRVSYLLAGACAGLIAAGLASALRVGPLGDWTPLPVAGVFALMQPAGGLWWLGTRDRKGKFRLWPLLRAGAAGGLLASALQFSPEFGLATGALTAAVSQIVSPWSRQAATYARYVERAAKYRRKVA